MSQVRTQQISYFDSSSSAWDDSILFYGDEMRADVPLPYLDSIEPPHYLNEDGSDDDDLRAPGNEIETPPMVSSHASSKPISIDYSNLTKHAWEKSIALGTTALSARGDIQGAYFPLHEDPSSRIRRYHPFHDDTEKARKESINTAALLSRPIVPPFRSHCAIAVSALVPVPDESEDESPELPNVRVRRRRSRPSRMTERGRNSNQHHNNRRTRRGNTSNTSNTSSTSFNSPNSNANNNDSGNNSNINRQLPIEHAIGQVGTETSTAGTTSTSPPQTAVSMASNMLYAATSVQPTQTLSPPAQQPSAAPSDVQDSSPAMKRSTVDRLQLYHRDMTAQAAMASAAALLSSANDRPSDRGKSKVRARAKGTVGIDTYPASVGTTYQGHPKSPRLAPMGSPGPVTPMELESGPSCESVGSAHEPPTPSAIADAVRIAATESEKENEEQEEDGVHEEEDSPDE